MSQNEIDQLRDLINGSRQAPPEVFWKGESVRVMPVSRARIPSPVVLRSRADWDRYFVSAPPSFDRPVLMVPVSDDVLFQRRMNLPVYGDTAGPGYMAPPRVYWNGGENGEATYQLPAPPPVRRARFMSGDVMRASKLHENVTAPLQMKVGTDWNGPPGGIASHLEEALR